MLAKATAKLISAFQHPLCVCACELFVYEQLCVCVCGLYLLGRRSSAHAYEVDARQRLIMSGVKMPVIMSNSVPHCVCLMPLCAVLNLKQAKGTKRQLHPRDRFSILYTTSPLPAPFADNLIN